MTDRLASALAAKIRRGDRIATSRCRHVPSRSSMANTSPATTEVSSGSTYVPAKVSTTSEPAQPVALIQRPNTVSDGSEPWWLTTLTSTAGMTQTTMMSSRIRQ
jgi:hypothetical protein